MPKGRPKAKNGARATRLQPTAASQAKSHNRGGTHRVREHTLTDTQWDHAPRKMMVRAAEGKDAYGNKTPEFEKYKEFFDKFRGTGVRVKDLKKVVLLQTLGDAENVLGRRAKEAEREVEKAGNKAREEKEEKDKQKEEEERRKRMKRQKDKDEGVLVTDSEIEETDAAALPERRRLSEQPRIQQRKLKPQRYSIERSDGDSDSDTTSTDSDLPISSSPKLRLFEWWHTHSESPSNGLEYGPGTRLPDEEVRTKEMPYISVNVLSIHTRKSLRLPGRNFKTRQIEPDFVPALSEHVKDSARNGVLTGPLNGARIESGSDWAERTIVQGWDGRMYFDSSPSLDENPDAKSEQSLAKVYQEWKGRYKKDRKSYAGVQKAASKRKGFRTKEQRNLAKNVYDLSKWRPKICYQPAYLGAPGEQPESIIAARKDIETLFYIILHDEEVPSFFFWADEEEWDYPVEPNPEFEEYEGVHLRRTSNQSLPSRRNSNTARSPRRRLSSFSRDLKFTRVKKTPTPRKFLPTTKIPRTSKYKTSLWVIERELYNHGYEATLHKYQQIWFGQGKMDAWMELTRIIRMQLPPGGFPKHPPVRDERDPSMVSVAEKMARVDAPLPSQPILPIFIQDDWTRRDDAYWITQERLSPTTSSDEDAVMQDAPLVQRPTSPVSPQYLSRRISDVFTWVSRISSPTSDSIYDGSVQQQLHQETNLALRVMTDEVPRRIPQYDLWKMMQERYQWQRQAPWLCAICFLELGDVPLEDYEQHLIDHMVRIARMCPFCEMPWDSLDGEDKADHVRLHRPTKDGDLLTSVRRRLTQTPPELQGWAAVPRILSNERQFLRDESTPSPKIPFGMQGRVAVPRRRSSQPWPQIDDVSRKRPSVKFSPTLVGQRVAYNDLPPTPESQTKELGGEASTSSGHGDSSLHRPTPGPSCIRKGPSKSFLKINSDRNGRRTLEYDLTDTDYRYRNAHDPRRRCSSASLADRRRDLIPYTYIDHNTGPWESDGWTEHAHTMARGGKVGSSKRFTQIDDSSSDDEESLEIEGGPDADFEKEDDDVSDQDEEDQVDEGLDEIEHDKERSVSVSVEEGGGDESDDDEDGGGIDKSGSTSIHEPNSTSGESSKLIFASKSFAFGPTFNPDPFGSGWRA